VDHHTHHQEARSASGINLDLMIRRIQDLMEINWSHQFESNQQSFNGITNYVEEAKSASRINWIKHHYIPLFGGSEGSQSSFQWHRSKKCFMCCYYFNRDDQHLQISSQYNDTRISFYKEEVNIEPVGWIDGFFVAVNGNDGALPLIIFSSSSRRTLRLLYSTTNRFLTSQLPGADHD